MAAQSSPARPSLSALRPMLIGNLLIVSGIALPILPASIVTFSCGSHSCLMGGPRVTLLSGWQIVTIPSADLLPIHRPAVVTGIENASYFTLAPVVLALLALLVLLWALLTRAAPSWLKLYRALAIGGVLILFLANVLATIAAQEPPVNTLALGAALALLYAAFLAMILGSTSALYQQHS